MDRFYIPPEQQKNGENYVHPVKVTSLIYLKEALADEAYEECDELINSALEFGATPEEITEVIDEHVKLLQKRYRNQASMVTKA